ncbi:F-box domain containing protein [Trema orientale]|uniref:F-box domain containing protein n=1 Tax=Trema orientale TaxID=63057 RepID=A0A2P5E684_TREOI|nr:F-box domain containing protein [Trema orientale]
MSKPLKTSTDRFTSLPEHVAHEILKFLPLEDISRLSVVSRTCRQVCISMPSLKVNAAPYRYSTTKRTQLMNYVDRLLSLRRGMDSRCLFIDWGLPSTEEEHRVLSWLHNAVVCNFKQLKLILRLKSGSEFTVPPSLLCSTSLESLTVNIGINALLKFPSYYSSINGFSSLKSLTLCGVRIDESFSNWVSICCKFLRKLCLSQIKETKSLVINSSSMHQLFISSTYNNELCHLQVSAETLEYMTLRWEFDDPLTTEHCSFLPPSFKFSCGEELS